jgi:hypothetical protein
MGNIRALAAYDGADGYRHVVGLDADCAVRETFFSDKGIGNDRLAIFASANHITGLSSADDGRQHAIVADGDGYLSEIHWKPNDIRWYEFPIPPFSNIVSIAGFYTGDDHYRVVVVATADGNITEVFYNPDVGVHITRPPLAQFPGVVSIAGFYTGDDHYRVVVVATADGNITEVFYRSDVGVHITRPPLAQFPGVVSIAGFYTADDNYRHVIVGTDDGNITEVFYRSDVGVHITQPPLARYERVQPALDEIAPQPDTIGPNTSARFSGTGAPSTAGRTLAFTGDTLRAYCLSENAGVWRSLGGSPWQQLPNSPVGYRGDPLVASPIDSSRLALGNSEGLWESTDAGQSWTQLGFKGAPSRVTGAAYLDAATLVATTSTDILYRDPAAGQISSTTLTSPADSLTALAISADIIVARSTANLWFSTNRGRIWEGPRTIPPTVTFAWNEHVILAAVGSFAYLLFGKPGPPGCARQSWLAVYDVTGGTWQTQPVQISSSDIICDGTGLTGGLTRFLNGYVLSDPTLTGRIGSRDQLFLCSGEEVIQATSANPDGTIQTWRRIVGAMCDGCPNTDPVHADIWGFHLDPTGRHAWTVGDGGVFADNPGPGADWSSRHWRGQNQQLRTHSATGLAVLPTAPTERPRILYTTGDNDYWWREASPHVLPVAPWESPDAVGDANWCTGDAGSPQLAVVCGHQIHQAAVTVFDGPMPSGANVVPNAQINLSTGDGFDGIYFFHVIQTPAHRPSVPLLDVLLLFEGALRCLDQSGQLITVSSAPGTPLLLRQRQYGSSPDANKSRLATWVLESDTLPEGTYGVSASGGSTDTVLYAWARQPGGLGLYRREAGQTNWSNIPVSGLVESTARFPTYTTPVFANPFNPLELIVLTSAGVLRSESGGAGFVEEKDLDAMLGHGSAAQVVHIAFHRGDPREAALATSSMVLFRDNTGAWHDLSNYFPRPTTGSIPSVGIDAESIYVVSDGRGIFRIIGHRNT